MLAQIITIIGPAKELLTELGYFRPSLRFWTWDSFPGAMKLADRVEQRIKTMGLTDTESAKVLRRFDEARRERRAWAIAGMLLLLVAGGCAWKLATWLRQRKALSNAPSH